MGDEGMKGWKAKFENAVQAFQDGHHRRALKLIDEVLSLGGSNSPTVHDSRAAVLEKLGEYRHALVSAKRVIKLSPQSARGYLRSAKIFAALSQYDKALDCYKIAMERCKDDAEVRESISERRKALEAERDEYEQGQRRAGTSFIGLLPVDVFLEIVVRLDSRSLLAVMAVSRRWHDTVVHAPRVWQRLELAHVIPVRHLKRAVRLIAEWASRSNDQLHTLSLDFEAFHSTQSVESQFLEIDKVIRRCSATLRTIELSAPDVVASRLFSTALSRCSNLRQLNLRSFGLPSSASGIENSDNCRSWSSIVPLEALTLIGGNFFSFVHADRLPRGLRHFELRDVEGPHALRIFTVLRRSAATLHTLILNNVRCGHGTYTSPDPDDDDKEDRHLSALKKLDIRESDQSTHQILGRFFIQGLHELFLSTATNSTLRTFARTGHGKMRRLEVDETWFVDEEVLVNECFPQWPRLEKLALRAGSVSNVLVEKLQQPYHRDEVSLSKDSSAPDMALVDEPPERTSQHGSTDPLLPRLRCLDLSDNVKITGGPLLRLVDFRRRLAAETSVESSSDDGGRRVRPQQYVGIEELVLDGCEQVDAEAIRWLRGAVPKVRWVPSDRNRRGRGGRLLRVD